MFNKRLIMAFSLSVALLTGCSTTHHITIDPTVTVESNTLTNDRVINVTTHTKLTNEVGSIQTGLNEHADIFTTNSVEDSVKQSVLDGLKKLGFTPDQGVLPATDMDIEITKMSYKTKVDGLKTIATLEFELRATVKAKGKTYKANFGSQKEEEYGTLPYQKTVEKNMNDLAGQTVDRLLKDPNILILLK